MGETVFGHFGSAPFFTIVDSQGGALEVIDNQNLHHSHGQCHPMLSLSGKGVEAVVTGGMGRRAIEMLNADGVKVFQAAGQTVTAVVDEFRNGNMPELTSDAACAGHDCH
jgi:predicted Fe-Mo cluster-binding NifX family protein